MKQPELFDVSRTTTVRCSVCGATREPTETRAAACSIDRDRDAGSLTHRRRPVGCLNTIDPQHTQIPY